MLRGSVTRWNGWGQWREPTLTHKDCKSIIIINYLDCSMDFELQKSILRIGTKLTQIFDRLLCILANFEVLKILFMNVFDDLIYKENVYFCQFSIFL